MANFSFSGITAAWGMKFSYTSGGIAAYVKSNMNAKRS
jgi:hypothetical protein